MRSKKIVPTISYSEMRVFSECRMRWHYLYQRQIQKPTSGLKLQIGTCGHETLAAHFRGDCWKKAICAWQYPLRDKLEGLEGFEEHWAQVLEAASIVRDVMPRYLERYAVNPRWHPKAVEQEFRVKLPGISKEFIAYIDLLAGDVHEGGLWIVDHKWTESFKDPWDLEMDLQIGSYEWLLGELGYDIRGTIYNQILAKKIVPPKLLANGKGLSQDKRQFCDVPTYLEAVERHGFDPDDYTEILAILQQKEFFRETRIYRTPEQTTHFRDEMMLRAKEMSRKAVPIWKSPSSLNCGRCMFRDLCIEQSRGRDIEWLIEAQYVPRERRNGADNAGSPASSAN